MSEHTDLTKWKLHVDRGRQVWKYHENQKPSDQQAYDRYFLDLDLSKDAPPLPKPTTVKEAARNAIDFFSKIQTEDGHWGNDYGGPHFLVPGFVITFYVSKTPLPEPNRLEFIRYLTNTQNKDGGWGLHVEDASTSFGTALNYIAMRLLGVDRDDPRAVKARARIHAFGGAITAPHWGKVWMCVLGVFDWDGVNAVLPELWNLPYWLPIHPGRFWCHCRVVYLPMAWLYGTKSVGEITPLVKQLREELYVQPYNTIDWPKARFNVHERDLYKPHSIIVKTVFPLMNIYDKCAPAFLRKSALDSTLDHIRYEDEQTKYIDIGPVNKPFDMLCEYFASGGKSEAFKKHQERLFDYIWLSWDGMKVQGYNGSQLWDTAFAMQAMCEVNLDGEFKQCIEKAWDYIDITQVREDAPRSEVYYRHISKGAWPFSTRDHGWPISDCTAEGFRAVMMANDTFKYLPQFPFERLCDAVNVMLSYQNSDGGWPTYENQRSYGFLEYLNPAECFDGIMVDYSYVETTSASIRSLLYFKKHHPTHRAAEIDSAVSRGVAFMKKIQRKDGSWFGSWAVCFTYGTWFGVEGLVAAGFRQSAEVNKACEFLLEKQRKQDGSWGEDFQSCAQRKWVDYKAGGTATHTAWACMTLMNAERDDPRDIAAVKRGIKWLCEQMLPNGNYKVQNIVGVFNFNCAIEYRGYRHFFAFWAMGRFINHYKFGKDCKLSEL